MFCGVAQQLQLVFLVVLPSNYVIYGGGSRNLARGFQGLMRTAQNVVTTPPFCNSAHFVGGAMTSRARLINVSSYIARSLATFSVCYSYIVKKKLEQGKGFLRVQSCCIMYTLSSKGGVTHETPLDPPL